MNNLSIGEILVSQGLLAEEALKKALEENRVPGERLGEVLVRLGLVTEEDVLQALSRQLSIPVIDLEEIEIDRELLAEMPSRFILRKELVPVERVSEARVLRVATFNPLALETLDELRLLLGCEVEPVIASREQIAKVLREYYGVGADTVHTLVEGNSQEVQVLEEKSEEAASALENLEDAGLIKFVNQILREAVAERSTDVHIEPTERDLRIRYRVDGILHQVAMPSQIKQFQAAIVSRLKIMAGLNIAEKRLPQDGRIKLRISGREIDVRISIIPMLFGEGVMLRLLDRESIFLGLEELGMASDTLRLFESLLERPHGIILVTGPTGCGKTTTLYAALSKINSLERKIITIEDPIEYQLEGVNQIQVRPQIGLNFANILRYVLRHDPDVIMVGEIRDLETAEMAIQAAMTGHLVFSTLHTNDAPSAVTRLVDMGIEPYLVASSVEAVMAQRLVRLVCRSCRQEYVPEPGSLPVGLSLDPGARLSRGPGCKECLDTGFRGRQGVFELFPLNEEIRKIILRRPSAGEIRELAVRQGMRTLQEDGWLKVIAGFTTPEEVLRVSRDEPAESGF